MKKILCVALTLLMCIAMLAGCGADEKPNNSDSTNTANPATNTENPGSESGTSEQPDGEMPTGEGVKITDAYTFTDPTGLDFDTRYVLYYGPDNTLVMAAADDGMLAEYTIIYARDEKAVAEYTFYVLDTAENAKALYNEMESYARTPDFVEGDDTVIVDSSDEYALEANLDIFVMGELLTDAKASTYVNFYIDYYGAERME